MDVMIKEVLGIQHRVSSIQHQSVKCTHLSIPTMPAEKILRNVRVYIAASDLVPEMNKHRRRSGFRLRFHFCGQDGAQEAAPTT
jgi:hypothetical protein